MVEKVGRPDGNRKTPHKSSSKNCRERASLPRHHIGMQILIINISA